MAIQFNTNRGVANGLQLARALMAQAREVAKLAGKGSRFARKLYEKELALHQIAAQPKTRAEKRAVPLTKSRGKVRRILSRNLVRLP